MATTIAFDFRPPLLERKRRLQQTLTTAGDTAHLIQLMQEVDAALERLDEGTYGLCEVCHEPIETERLAADPLVCVCLDHLTDAQQRSLEHDLELAARIQGGLLPENGLRTDGWTASYRYLPAGPVSGDYCDLVPLPDGGLIFVVGDVSGKGVAASLLMAHLHALFHSLATPDLSVGELVARANRLFCESTLSTQYATLVCGRAHPTGHIDLCNAGHCAPLLLSRQQATALDATGLPIGLFADLPYAVHEVRLRPGDSLFLYTDGLSEAQRGEAFYGTDRLTHLAVGRNGDKGFLDTCLRDVDAFLQGTLRGDDLTLMVLQRSL